MRIVPGQLHGTERVFFATAQAIVCVLALYLSYVAASVLAVEAMTPGQLDGRSVKLAFSLMLAFSLIVAAGTAFLAWTFARGAKIGVTRREGVVLRAAVALAVLGSAGASLYYFLR